MTVNLAAHVSCVCVSLFLLVAVLVSGERHFRFEKHPGIQKRDFPVTLILGVALSMFALFRLIGSTLMLSGADTKHDYLWSMMATTLMDGALTTMLLRSWLIYFEMKHGIAIRRGQWVRHITQDGQAKVSFWIGKRETYGNRRWLGTRLFAIWSAMATVVICGWLIKSDVMTLLYIIFQFLAYCVILVFFAYISYRMPSFEDRWLIRDEMLLITRILFSGFAVAVILAAILYSKMDYESRSASLFLYAFIIGWLALTSVSVFYGCFFLSKLFPIYYVCPDQSDFRMNSYRKSTFNVLSHEDDDGGLQLKVSELMSV